MTRQNRSFCNPEKSLRLARMSRIQKERNTLVGGFKNSKIIEATCVALSTKCSLQYPGHTSSGHLEIKQKNDCTLMLESEAATKYAVQQEGRKGTISQYFTTLHCPVCIELTQHWICSKCRRNPQHVGMKTDMLLAQHPSLTIWEGSLLDPPTIISNIMFWWNSLSVLLSFLALKMCQSNISLLCPTHLPQR